MLDKIPHHVLDALRERGYSDDEITRMEPKAMFKQFCEWEGLHNWSNHLWNTVEALQKLKS